MQNGGRLRKSMHGRPNVLTLSTEQKTGLNAASSTRCGRSRERSPVYKKAKAPYATRVSVRACASAVAGARRRISETWS